MPRREEAIAKHLGDRSDSESWLRYEDDPAVHSPVVHFAYPSVEQGGFDYLRREVKLELGSLRPRCIAWPRSVSIARSPMEGTLSAWLCRGGLRLVEC